MQVGWPAWLDTTTIKHTSATSLFGARFKCVQTTVTMMLRGREEALIYDTLPSTTYLKSSKDCTIRSPSTHRIPASHMCCNKVSCQVGRPYPKSWESPSTFFYGVYTGQPCALPVSRNNQPPWWLNWDLGRVIWSNCWTLCATTRFNWRCICNELRNASTNIGSYESNENKPILYKMSLTNRLTLEAICGRPRTTEKTRKRMIKFNYNN